MKKYYWPLLIILKCSFCVLDSFNQLLFLLLLQSDLIADKSSLNYMRELLFIIRLWGRTNEGILPSYTKTAESFDVLAKLFSLLTRLKDGQQQSNEAIIDECILLPSQVMIPPLDIVIPPRGLSHLLIAYNRGPISSYFMQEPDLDASNEKVQGPGSKFDQTPLIEGAMVPRHYMDNVRQMYLGKPYVIRECTRCTATSLPPPNTQSSSSPMANDGKTVKGWDRRWSIKCPCGGPWKLNCLDENFSRRNLLATV